MAVNSSATFAELKGSGRLPTPRGVALRLMELAKRDDTSAGEITRVLQGDPALSGRLLKAANSAQRGSRAAVSVADAVVRLGMRSVRQLAMSFSLIDRAGSHDSKEFDFDGFWARSLATAVVAERLAREGRIIVPDEAFTLALLLDVGELAFAALKPAEFDRLALAQRAGKIKLPNPALERETFGLDRVTLTAMMLEDWMLPQAFVEAVRARADLEASARLPARTRQLAEMLDLAAVLGERFAASRSLSNETRVSLVARLPRDGEGAPADLGAFLEEVAHDWHEWGALLVVKTPAVNTPALLADEAGEGEASGGTSSLSALLVLDAAHPDRAALQAACSAAGFRVRVARDLDAAGEAIAQKAPDLVVAELDALCTSGQPRCEALHALMPQTPPHVLLIAAPSAQDKLAMALASGVDDFVARPLVPLELTARLQAAARIAQLKLRLRQEADALRGANAALEDANRRLEEMARTDSLTGLPNRRRLLERLRESWSETLAGNGDFAVICVDLDHFKKINDDRGHEAGDIVLERVGRVLRRSVRATDIVGRFGGEEFVVLCPGVDLVAAMRLAERIRAQLALEEFSIGEATWRVTASLGVSGAKPAVMKDWRNLLRQADAALFEAKRRGRNRVWA